MTEKECSHHKEKRQKRIQRLCGCLLITAFIILVVFLITWAILQPKKPRFIIQDATLYSFNVSSNPNIFSSNFQVTIFSRNPNDKIGIYYDKLDIFATYRSQQITYFTSLPPTYQGHKAVDVWSPYISGNNVPVAPFNTEALRQDQQNGFISLVVKINGRIRWKVGTSISGHYHLHVTCAANIPFGHKNTDDADDFYIQTSVKYQLATKCKVSV